MLAGILQASPRTLPHPAAVLLLAVRLSLDGLLAHAQAPGDSVPSRVYFNVLPAFHDGAHRDSLGVFLNGARGGIKTVDARWIDSICYFAMAGECYYQMGQLQQALDSYNSALELYVANSDWMMRLQFPAAIPPAVPTAVRSAPWVQSRRGARVGQFPDTFMMGQGRIDNSAAVLQGGVIQQAVLFPVHVSEIVRCTSLAIRRRRELLGPVCKFDPLTNQVLDALARRPGPRNHWSEAWISVQLGCAYAAAGSVPQAISALERSLLVQGEFDHPLTSTALVELGRLAFDGGEYVAAQRYAEEAAYAAVLFPNPGVLEEATRLATVAHILTNPAAAYAPLSNAIAWSKTQSFRHLQASLMLSAAESLSVAGDAAQAATLLSNARATAARSDLMAGQCGARLNHLAAQVSYQTGNLPAGDQSLAQALAFERSGSLWMFHIAEADRRYLRGELTDRVATLLYGLTLRDPTPGDWSASPLECLAMLTTPHPDAIEHWFECVIKNSREQELPLEIADRARRHRFFSTLPMGGRLTALRWILEGPPELLGERGLLERRELLGRFPQYGQLAEQANKIRADLAARPVVEEARDARRHQTDKLAALADVSQKQELVLRQVAVRRQSAEMVFPPLRTTRDVQRNLTDGQVLLAFFAAGKNLYAFLYSHEKYASWKVQSPAQLHKQLGAMLREMGNYDMNHELTPNELTKGAWRTSAARAMHLLFEKSNVDLAGEFDEIVIVPDGPLWYLPFEALSLGKGEKEKLLISHARVRYAPTVGLAVPYSRVQKPSPRVGVVVGKLHPQDDESVASAAFEDLSHAVSGAVALPRPLPSSSMFRVLLDELIVLDDIQHTSGPYEWSPAPLERGKTGAALNTWLSLPWGGPERVILPGFHTAAENGVRKSQASGEEVFLTLCGLMSSGVRTILISRWRAGGQTSFDLVREFAQELPHSSPADAWRRSVRIASETPLEVDREPRVKKVTASSETAKGDHPFFWSGLMLVDSGVLPPGKDHVLEVPGLNAPKKEEAGKPNEPPKAEPPNPIPPAGAAEIAKPAAGKPGGGKGGFDKPLGKKSAVEKPGREKPIAKGQKRAAKAQAK